MLMKRILLSALLLLPALLCAGPKEDALFAALREDDPAAARAALEQGADPNTPLRSGLVPLLRVRTAPMAKVLLEYGATFPKEPLHGQTPTRHLILNQADAKALALLVPHDAQTDLARDGTELLLLASQVGRPEAIAYLRAQGVQPKAKLGFTPVALAAMFGSVESLRALLEGGASPCTESPEVPCPIQNALAVRQGACAKLLWEAGCRHVPELSYRLSQNPPEAEVEALIETHRAELETGGQVSPLAVAANHGKLGWVRAMVERGAGEKTGLEAALEAAASEGHWEVVDYLLINRARPTTAVLEAAVWNANPYTEQRPKEDFLRTLDLLLEKAGTYTEAEQHLLLTMSFATRNPGGSPEAIRKLLAHGFPLSARNAEGQSVEEAVRKLCTDNTCAELSPEVKALLK